ncbi:signal transduction histidine kinase/ligand-binding sensor domain-containing protein/CheY-like chemotaxis protein [Xanthomonas arboricola]|uniref:hybrid sensor histidine kinase/response regulator n=1 Tax=Xanthomonas sp. 3793 TaxID=3035312 RepID=UPI0021684191|nr:two-component regulator propeller domain-containing protein [Xanthomonas sp. 3793]MCS3745441.1 signal transduction histidine kinase/ligand-binding sensor domain-containing protein/CheY-like chemotaxis protein [Xanthomonas sp. 3793]
MPRLRFCSNFSRTLAALWLVLLITAVPVLASAAVPTTPVPIQLTVADGLPSNTVNDFAEDRNGYLWLATADGLARFDGRSYRIWRMEDGLTDNFVWALGVDADDGVWVGLDNGGVGVLDAKRRLFKPLESAQFPELRRSTVWAIAQTPDGDLWFGTSRNGLYRRRSDGSMQRFTFVADDAKSLPGNNIAALRVTPDGSLWIGGNSGVARWTGKNFERVKLPGNMQYSNGMRLDSRGTLWVTDGNYQLYRLNSKRQFVTQPWYENKKEQRVIGVLLRDRAGRYWLDTMAGLGISNGKDVVNVPIYSLSAHGLIKPSWSSAYEDREGGIWFASLNGGLWHLPPNWNTFAVLSYHTDDRQSISNPFVKASAVSASGGVWIAGTRGVLERLDPNSGVVERHLQPIYELRWPTSLVESRSGYVWIGLPESLVRYDPRTKQRKRWPLSTGSASMNYGNPERLALDAQGRLWIYLTNAGLQIRDGEGRLIREIAHGSHGLETANVYDLRLGPDGQMWLANTTGLRRWDPKADTFVMVRGAPASTNYVFRFTDSGVVWIGLMGELRRYLWDGTQLKHLDTIDRAQEFPMVAPNGLVVDGAGVAWVSSARGLIRVDPASKMVRVYGVHDGLPNQQFQENTLVRATGGQILGGTPDGVVLFDPTQMRPNTRQPPLLIERVGLRRGERGLDVTGVEPLQLQDGDRDLHIVARMPTFTHSESTSYRFRLSGYDPDWIDVGPGGERLFSRLPSGHYTLEVQGRTADGIWSTSQTLRFQVLPPWWLSPWGLGLLALLSVCVVVAAILLYRRRLRRLNAWQLAVHKQEVAEQASLAKTRFLATLGHEVRTPMTGVLGMSELLLKTSLDTKQRSYTDSIRRAGAHLLRLVNDALDLARIESGRLELDLEPFSVRQLVAEVEALMAPLAQERGLRFSLEIGLFGDITASGDSTRIRQILLNLLSNAIKFTERGVVGLKLTTLGSYQGLRFEVADTGPGINAEQKARLFQRFEQGDGAKTSSRYGGSGLGLAICQELALAMGGHIEVISRLGAGTRFVVDLPLRWVASNATLGGEAGRAGAAVAPQRILLVEDDPTIAEVIVGLLRAQGHSVVHAPHGLAALTEAADNTFDLALLDLDLPGLDGFALARQLRVFGYEMPLIAVTARSDEAAEPGAQEAGFDCFLRKPLTGDMLADTIAEALRSKR